MSKTKRSFLTTNYHKPQWQYSHSENGTRTYDSPFIPAHPVVIHYLTCLVCHGGTGYYDRKYVNGRIIEKTIPSHLAKKLVTLSPQRNLFD